VVELIADDVARKVIEQALRRQTRGDANKALLAQAGAELLALARSRGLTVSFEASAAANSHHPGALRTADRQPHRRDYGIVNERAITS